MFIRGTGSRPMPEDQARRRARYFVGLVWHVGAFLIINASFWILDLTLGRPGLQWAFWITGVWGFALAFHALAYYVDGRSIEERKYEQFMKGHEHHSGRGGAAA